MKNGCNPTILALLCLCIPLTACDDAVVPVERSAAFLEDEVAEAVQIARVRVESVEPVYLNLHGHNATCGFLYKAQVVDSLKGGWAPPRFFAADNLQIGVDYLVFIHKRTNGSEADLAAVGGLQSADQDQQLLCRENASEDFLPVNRQVYFEIRKVRTGATEQEWLAARDPKHLLGFMWCNADWPYNHPRAPRGILRTKNVTINNVDLRMVEWTSARRAIEDALSNSPYWWFGIRNPFFEPQSC
jgi:hypothetical protein